MENLSKQIQEQAELLLTKSGFEGEVRVTSLEHDTDSYLVAITLGVDQNFLIGQHGVNLIAFQHLLRLLCRKITTERFNLVVDVNGYLQEKKAALENEAEKAFSELEKTKEMVSLRPMLPYERKIIHTFFLQHPTVVTESIGIGAERKIEIRFKD